MPNEKRNLDKLVKRRPPGPSTPLNHAEQIDAWATRLRHVFDPVAFCKEVFEWEPDPWQCEMIRSEQRKMILNLARQSGKSTASAAKAVHRAVLFPKSLILLVAPTIPQASELRRKVDDFVSRIKGVKPQEKESNKRTLEFENGSRIVLVAADSDTVRSYSAVTMIIEDESQHVLDPVFEAMEPMLLVSKGQHILMGTPSGLKGHFAEFWHDGGATWHRFQMSAWDNPRVSRETLEALKEEKTRMGRLWWFQQEYECSFIAAAQGLVYPFERKKNLSPALPRDRRFGWQYVLGIDYGFNDSTAYVVLGWQRDDPNVYVIESMDKRGLTPAEAGEIALGYTKKYPFARMVGDTGGLGKGYVEEARRRYRLPLEPAEKNNKRGYIEIMAGDMRAGLLKVFPGNEGLIDEWTKLPWDEERDKPADGYKDHLADAALYGYRATLHYLEEVRKAGPKKGTPEAYKAEADEMLEARIQETLKKDNDWWEQGDAKWADQQEQSWMN